ncbi:MAG: hypothetical protein WCL14_06345 [Bacteroidota bacterium]
MAPLLTTARPSLKGGTSFVVLNQIYPIGMARYASKQPLFLAKNAKWTIVWGTNLSSDLAIAFAMPDNTSRQGLIDGKRILMDIQTVNCIVIANDLSGLIENSFPSNLWQEKKIEAGFHHYAKASTKPGECSLMITQGIAFMLVPANNTALVAGGKLVGFQAAYTLQKTTFDDSHNAYTSAVSDAQEHTDTKIAAFNLIYDNYMQMARVAKNLFRNDLAILNFFVFNAIKKTIQPQYQDVETVRIEKASDKIVANAIPSTPITNIGTLPVFINDTVSLAAGATINNTFGDRIKFSNRDALYPCAIRMTRMVHQG